MAGAGELPVKHSGWGIAHWLQDISTHCIVTTMEWVVTRNGMVTRSGAGVCVFVCTISQSQKGFINQLK